MGLLAHFLSQYNINIAGRSNGLKFCVFPRLQNFVYKIVLQCSFFVQMRNFESTCICTYTPTQIHAPKHTPQTLIYFHRSCKNICKVMSLQKIILFVRCQRQCFNAACNANNMPQKDAAGKRKFLEYPLNIKLTLCQCYIYCSEQYMHNA